MALAQPRKMLVHGTLERTGTFVSRRATPAYFAWTSKQWGYRAHRIEQGEALEAAYQMTVYINLRESNGTDEVKVIVPDRRCHRGAATVNPIGGAV